MKGKMLIYHAHGALADAPTVYELTRPEPMNGLLDKVRAGVGGDIEIVPHFTTISIDGEIVPCVALCNEHGKNDNLPVNRRATVLWDIAIARATGTGLKTALGQWLDVLNGPVVILVGDEEFRRSL